MSDNFNADIKRSPGRPKQQEGLKKGNSSWKPASFTDVANKEPGYRYRWLNKHPENLAKKQAEGWEMVSGINAANESPAENNRLNEGKPLTTAYEKYDAILAKIPEEVAQGRDTFFNEKTARQTEGLTAHIKKELGKEGASTHGEITISSRKNADF